MKFKCPICGCEDHFNIQSIGATIEIPQYSSDGTIDDNAKKVIQKPSSLFIETTYKGYGECGDSTSISPNFTTLICKKCGHVDLFYDHKGLELKVSEYKKSMSDIEFKINEVKKTLNEIDKQYKDNLAEIEDIQNKLSSDEITVREQKELTEKANILKQATRNYNYERKKIEGKIKELEVAKHRIINPHISDED